MPAIKLPNGKWKWGEHGSTEFDTKREAEDQGRAIHARKNARKDMLKRQERAWHK